MTRAFVTVVRGGGVIGSAGEGILDITRRLGLAGCPFDASDEDATAYYAEYEASGGLLVLPAKTTLNGDDLLGVSEIDGDTLNPFKMTADYLAAGLIGLGLVGGLALGGTAGKLAYTTGAHVYGETTITALGRALVGDTLPADVFNTLGITAFTQGLFGDADAAAARTRLAVRPGTDVQAFDATLLSLAGLGTAANKIAYTTGVDTWAETAITATGRTLIAIADAAAGRTALSLVPGTDVQAFDATLLSIAALGTGANKIAYTTGADTWAEAILSPFGRTLIDDTDAAAARATMSLVPGTDIMGFDATLTAIAALGTGANKIIYTTGVDGWAETGITATGRTLIAGADAAAMRVTLSLVPGTDVQAQDAELAAIAGLVSAADRLPYFTGLGTASLATFSAFARTLLDDADQATMQTTLGLVPGVNVQAFNARLASIASTGIVAEMLGESVLDTDITLAANSDSRIASQAATKAYVGAQVAALVASSPSTLDTLNELATALGDDPAFATTMATALGLRVRVDAAQSLTSGQKTQARANIGAVIGTDVQAFDATLLSLAGLGTAANKIAYTTGVDTWAETAITATGRTLIAIADAAAGRTALNLVPGTDVQAFDATLLSIAALGTGANKLAYTTGVDTWAETAFTAFARTLIDDADQATMQTTLGLVPGTNVQAQDATLGTLAGKAFTGTGSIVLATAPAIAGGSHTALTGLGIRSTGAAFDLTLASSEVLSAGRTLSIVMGDAARTLTLGGNPSLSGVTISGTGTLATTAGKTTTFSNTLTFAGTDGSNVAFGAGGTVLYSGGAIVGGSHTQLTSLGIRSTGAAFDLTLASSEVLTAGRTLSIVMGDAARTLTLGGSPTISGVTISGTGTLATTAGKTSTFSNTLTFAGTDGSSVAFGGGGTVAYTASPTFTGTAGFAAGTFSGNVVVGGTTNSPTGFVSVGTAVNTQVLYNGRYDINNNMYGFNVVNGSTGVGATVLCQLSNNVNAMQFLMFGSGFTSSGFFRQGGGFITADGPGGLTLLTAAAQPVYVVANSSGGVQLSSGATAWSAISDYRAKIRKGGFAGAGTIVDGIPVHLAGYRAKVDGCKMPTTPRAMFFAHEVAEGGVPWAVDGAKNGERFQTLQSTDPLVPVLWAALRETRSQAANDNAAMTKQITALEARLAKLEKAT